MRSDSDADQFPTKMMLSDKDGGGFNDNNDKETWMQWTVIRDKGVIMNFSGYP